MLPNFPAYSHMLGNFDDPLDGDTATARTICFNPMVFKGEQKQIMFRSASGTRTNSSALPTAGGMTRRVESKCFDKIL